MATSKMGVSPIRMIKNRSMRYGTDRTGTLANSVTTSTNPITITDTDPDLDMLLRSGDRIVLGPSTDVDYLGKSEVVIVSSVSGNEVTLTSTTDYGYANGDPISFTGTRLAGNWNLALSPGGGTGNDSYILPLEITNENSPEGGMSDNFYQKIQMKFADDTYNYCEIRQALGNVLIPEAYYRLGLYYKASFPGDPAVDWILRAKINDTTVAGSPFLEGVITRGSSGNTDSWTEFTKTDNVSSSPTVCNIAIYLYRNNETNASYATFYFDDIWLEHAVGTDDANSGVYTFDGYPDGNGYETAIIETSQRQTLANSNKYVFDPTGQGRGIRKWMVRGTFTNAPMTLWNNLLILKQWQDRGYPLVFHIDGDYDETNSYYIQRSGEKVPPTMYGFMKITPTTRGIWDIQNRISFNFEFEEI